MLRISQIKLPPEHGRNALEHKVCEILRITKDRLISVKTVRRSIEARRKEQLSYVYTADVNVKDEKTVLRRNKNKNITVPNEKLYSMPVCGEKTMSKQPVVIGSGPAGLFCAYILAQKGFKPLVLERGEQIEDRKKSVENFWNGGDLDPESNVQFGEGGAGTFSDGKLNTGVTDKEGRIRYVLDTFVKFGAKEEITFDSKPHVGTDILFNVVKNMRNEIIRMGGEFRFSTCVKDIVTEDDSLTGVLVNGGEVIEAEAAVAATGHSARDTVKMLYEKGVYMEPKSFAVGVRIQHPQELINESQWGKDAPAVLGAAPYKLTAKAQDGRGVYTFCMCPGGYIVNASSEENRLAVNGMSYSGRSSGFANSALIVTVDPQDFIPYSSNELPDVLNAISFQRELEGRAFKAGSGKIPVQRFKDFRENRITVSNSFEPCTKGDWIYADVRGIFPEFISEDIISAAYEMGRKLSGFDCEDALLMGVESRTSSPVRLTRNEMYQSNIKGLYPCGEGAGYAGGIVSAAVDGIKTAEHIIQTYRPDWRQNEYQKS